MDFEFKGPLVKASNSPTTCPIQVVQGGLLLMNAIISATALHGALTSTAIAVKVSASRPLTLN